MDNLVSVIGPAPSELSWSDLKIKLQKERERTRKGFEYWNSAVGRPVKSTSGISLKDIKAVAKTTGLTVTEVEQLLKAELERKQT